MGLVVFLIVLAVVFAAVSLVVHALKWLLIIAATCFIVSALMGWNRRSG